MKVHILAPTVLNPAVGKGGTTLYRSVAVAAGRHASTTVYEIAPPPPAGSPRWAGGGVSVVSCDTPAEVRTELCRRVGPRDTVLKWAGALGGGGEGDWAADLWVGELASTVDGVRCWYLDADAPFRLPLLNGRHHLGPALRAFDGVLLFAGGQRAVDGYTALAGPGAVVRHVSPAMFAVSLMDVPVPPPVESDLLVTVAAASAREDRVAAAVRSWLATDPALTLTLVGDWPESSPLPNVRTHGLMDPTELFRRYQASRFTLNTLRGEFAGWTDTAAARIFEAALAGSVLVTEAFPGLDRYLTPRQECVVAELPDVPAAIHMPEARRTAMAERARRRVEEAAAEAEKEFIAVIRATPPRPGRQAPSFRPADPATVTVLPGVSAAFVARLRERLPAARFVPADGEALVTTTAAKNRVDDELRAVGRIADVVYVEVTDRVSALGTRWIPGRDRTLDDDDRWPWIS
ncbi:glycosyltransferase family protein [Streptosporangium sandarakinum]|uniref:glycosyltransferase family protein n=1 Tax=Streptosporangium sandarakinum TaxID=1260955 RepID=UPI0037B4DF3D